MKTGLDLGSDLTEILTNDPKIQESLANLNSQLTSQIGEILASSLPKFDLVSPMADQFRNSLFTDEATETIDKLVISTTAPLAKQLSAFSDLSSMGLDLKGLTAGLDSVTDFRAALPDLNFLEVSGSGFDALKTVVADSVLAAIEIPETQMLKIDTSTFDNITKNLDVSFLDTVDTTFIDKALRLTNNSIQNDVFDTSQLAQLAQSFNTSFLEDIDVSIFDQWEREQQSESTLVASDAAILTAVTYIALASVLAAAIILAAPVALSAAESTWVMTLLLLELTTHLTESVPGFSNLLNFLDLKDLILGGGGVVEVKRWLKNRKTEPE